MSDSENNLSYKLKEIIISDPKRKINIEFNNLWERNKTPLILIHWLRRFG